MRAGNKGINIGTSGDIFIQSDTTKWKGTGYININTGTTVPAILELREYTGKPNSSQLRLQSGNGGMIIGSSGLVQISRSNVETNSISLIGKTEFKSAVRFLDNINLV